MSSAFLHASTWTSLCTALPPIGCLRYIAFVELVERAAHRAKRRVIVLGR